MSTGGRLVWMLRRLSLMSSAELGHRLWQFLQGLIEGTAGNGLSKLIGSPRVIVPESTSFFSSKLPQLLVPAVRRDGAHEERLLASDIPVFGRWVQIKSTAEFWRTDPLAGNVWPLVHWRKIDYRPGNPTGDVRALWELNRLQHLFSLAIVAHFEEGSRDVAVALVEAQLEGWRVSNPPGSGANYISAMEEALRLISLLHTYDLVRNWLSTRARNTVASIVGHHAWHIERRLSLYSSAGNHTIAEAVGLLYAGVLLSDCAPARRWKKTALKLLRTEAARQVDSDGGGIEQATWYLLFVTDLLGLAQALLAHRGEAPEPAVDAAVARSRGFLNALANGPDDLPRIGDADDGYALSPGLRISWQENRQTRVARSYPVAGLSLDRDPERDHRLIFLHNPLGMAPGYGHGHADCLSVIFRHAGVDLLIDPGTGQYGGAAEYRRYFRSALGHNTATVDGADYAEQAGAFLWRGPYQPESLQADFDADGCVLLVRHDAFRKQRVTHHRGVAYRPGRFLAVWDHFAGAEGHDVRLHWHLGCVPASCDLAAGRIELVAGAKRVLLEVSGATVTLSEGSQDPLLGWQSRRYGSLDPCPTVELTADPTASSDQVLTVLWLGKPEPIAVLDPWVAGFAARITVQI